MTGRRIGEDDFPQSDETDEEYDEIVKLREIFGYIDIDDDGSEDEEDEYDVNDTS